MFYLIFVIYFILLLFLLKRQWVNNAIMELIPSFIWLLLIAVPFVFQLQYFDTSVRFVHGFGVFFVGFSLLFADTFNPLCLENFKIKVKFWEITITSVYFAVFCVFIIQIYHLYSMPHIPIIQGLINPELRGIKIALMREAASKKIELSPIIIYLAQASILITPILVSMLLNLRKFVVAFLICFFSSFYAISTTAYGPFVSMLLVGLIVFYANLKTSIQFFLSKLLVFGIATSLIVFTFFYITINSHILPFANKSEFYRQEFIHPPLSSGGVKMRHSLGDYIRSDFLLDSLGRSQYKERF